MGSLIATELSRLDSLAPDSYAVQLRADSAWLPIKSVLSSVRLVAPALPPDPAAIKALGQAEVLAAFALDDQEAFQALQTKLISALQGAAKGLNSAGLRGTEEMEEVLARTQLAMRRYRWLVQKAAVVLRVEKPPSLRGRDKVEVETFAGVCTLCALLQQAPNSEELRSALVAKTIELCVPLGPMSLLSADSSLLTSLSTAADLLGQWAWEEAKTAEKAQTAIALLTLALAKGSLGDVLSGGVLLMRLQQLPPPLQAAVHKVLMPLSSLPERLSTGRVEFTWNTAKKGPDIAISNLGKTITRTDSAGWGCNLSTQAISDGTCYIEFKIDKNSSSCLLLGLAGPAFDSYSSKSSCNGALTLQSDSDLYLDGNGIAKVFRYSENDKVGMLINMEQHTLTYFLNGKPQEQAAFAFPYKQVYLCVCFGGSEQFVTIDTESDIPLAAQEHMTKTIPAKKWLASAEERLPVEARSCTVRQMVTFLLSELSRYATIYYHSVGVNSYTGTEIVSGRQLRTGRSLLLDLRTGTFERLIEICEMAVELADPRCLAYALKLLRVQLFALTYAQPSATLETALCLRIKGFLTTQLLHCSAENSNNLTLVLSHGLNCLYPQPCDKLELLLFALNDCSEALAVIKSGAYWEGMLEVTRPEDLTSALTALKTLFLAATGPRPLLLDTLAVAQKVLLSKAEEKEFVGAWGSLIADYATALLEKSADLLVSMSTLPDIEIIVRGRNTVLEQLLSTLLYALSLCRLPIRVLESILAYLPGLIQSLATVPVCSSTPNPAFLLESAHPCIPPEANEILSVRSATSYSLSFDRSSDIGSAVLQIWQGVEKAKKLMEWTGPNFPREAVSFPAQNKLKLMVLPGKQETWGWKVTVTPHGEWREPNDWIEEVRKSTYSFLTYAAKTLIEGSSVAESSLLDSPLFQCGISDKCEMAVRGQRPILEPSLPLLAQLSYRVRKGDAEMPSLRRSVSQFLTKHPSPLHSLSTYLSAFTASSPLVYSENRDMDMFIRGGERAESRWKELKQEAGAVGPAASIGGTELEQTERGLFCVFFSLFGLSDRFNELFEGLEPTGDQLNFLIRQTTQFRRWAQSFKQDHNFSYSALTVLLLPRLSVLLRLPFDSLRVSLGLGAVRCLTVKSYSKANTGSLELNRQRSVEQAACNVQRIRSLLSVTMPERSGVDERLQKDWKRASTLVYDFLGSEDKLESWMEIREQRRNRALLRCLGLNMLVDVMKSRNRSRDMERLACNSLSKALLCPTGERKSHMSGLTGIDPVLSQCVQTSFFTLYQALACSLDLTRFKALDCTSEEVAESCLALMQALACPIGPNEMDTLGKLRLRSLLECLLAWAKGQGITELGRKRFDISKCITDLEVINRRKAKKDKNLLGLNNSQALRRVYGGSDKMPIQKLALAEHAPPEFGPQRAKIGKRGLFYTREPPAAGQVYLTNVTLASSDPVRLELHTAPYEHLLIPDETQEESDARSDRKKRLRQAAWALLRLLTYSICGSSKTDPNLVQMHLSLISSDLVWGLSQAPLLATDLTNRSKLHLRKVSQGGFWLESTIARAKRPTNSVAEWTEQIQSLCAVLAGREFSPALQEFARGYSKAVARFIAAIDPTYSGVVRLADIESAYREEMAGYVNAEGYVDFFMFAKGQLSMQLADMGLEIPYFPVFHRLPNSFSEGQMRLGHGTILGILSQLDIAVKLRGCPIIARLLGWFQASSEPGRVPQSIFTDSVPSDFLNPNKELDLLTALTAVKRNPVQYQDYWTELQTVPISWDDLPCSCEDLCRNSASLSALSASLLWTLYQCMRSTVFETTLSESSLMREIMSYAFASGSEVLSVLGFRLMRRLFASSCSVPVVQRLWAHTPKAGIDHLTDTGDMVKTLVALAGLQVGLHLRPKQPNKALSLSAISQLSGEALECLQAMYLSPQWRSQVVTRLSQVLHSLCSSPANTLAASSALELGALAILSQGENSSFDLREWACIELSDSTIQTAVVLSLHQSKSHVTLYSSDESTIKSEPILHVNRTISPYPVHYFLDLSEETAQETALLLMNVVKKAAETDYSQAESVETAVSMRMVWAQAAALAIRGLNMMVQDRTTLDSSIFTPILQYFATLKPGSGVIYEQSKLQALKERLYLRYYNPNEPLMPLDEPMTSDKQNQILASMPEEKQVLVAAALSLGLTFEKALAAIEAGAKDITELKNMQAAPNPEASKPGSLIYKLDKEAVVRQMDHSGTALLHRYENGGLKLTAMEVSNERKGVAVDVSELVMGRLKENCEGIGVLVAVSGREFGVGLGSMEIDVWEEVDGVSVVHDKERVYRFPKALETYEFRIFASYKGAITLSWPGLSPLTLPTLYPDAFTGLSLAPLVLSLPANRTASVTLKGLAVCPYNYTDTCEFWKEAMAEDGQLVAVAEYHGCTTAQRLEFAGIPRAVASEFACQFPAFKPALGAVFAAGTPFPAAIPRTTDYPIQDIKLQNPGNSLPEGYEVVPGLEPSPLRCPLLFKRASQAVGQAVLSIHFGDSPGSKVGNMSLAPEEYPALPLAVVRGVGSQQVRDLKFVRGIPEEIVLETGYFLLKSAKKAVNFALRTEKEPVFLAIRSSSVLLGAAVVDFAVIPKEKAGYGLNNDSQPRPQRKPISEQTKDYLKYAQSTLPALYSTCMLQEQAEISTLANLFLLQTLHKYPLVLPALCSTQPHLVGELLALARDRRKDLEPGLKLAFAQIESLPTSLLLDCVDSLSSWKYGQGSYEEAIESIHPYENNMRIDQVITISGAKRLVISFDLRTRTEGGCDFVRFYSLPGHEKLLYERAGSDFPTLEVEGNTVHFSFYSDGSGVEWGYKFTVTGIREEYTGMESETGLWAVQQIMRWKPKHYEQFLRQEYLYSLLVFLHSAIPASERRSSLRLLSQLLVQIQPLPTHCREILSVLAQDVTQLYQSEQNSALSDLTRCLLSLFLSRALDTAIDLAEPWFLGLVKAAQMIQGFVTNSPHLDTLLFKHFLGRQTLTFAEVYESPHPYQTRPAVVEININGAKSLELTMDPETSFSPAHAFYLSYDSEGRKPVKAAAAASALAAWLAKPCGPDIVLSNDSQTVTRSNSSGWGCVLWGTHYTSGQHRFTYFVDNGGSSDNLLLGLISGQAEEIPLSTYLGSLPKAWVWKRDGLVKSPAEEKTLPEAAYNTGDVLSLFLDFPTASLTITKNGQDIYRFEGVSESVTPIVCFGGSNQFITAVGVESSGACQPLFARYTSVPGDTVFCHFPVNSGYSRLRGNTWALLAGLGNLITVSEEQTKITRSGEPDTWVTMPFAASFTRGKHYGEVEVVELAGENLYIGLVDSGREWFLVPDTYFSYSGELVVQGSSRICPSSFTQGDRIGLYLDLEQASLAVVVNGSILQTADFIPEGKEYCFAVSAQAVGQQVRIVSDPQLPRELDLYRPEGPVEGWGFKLAAVPKFAEADLGKLLHCLPLAAQEAWVGLRSRFKGLVLRHCETIVQLIDSRFASIRKSPLDEEPVDLTLTPTEAILYSPLTELSPEDLNFAYICLKDLNTVVMSALPMIIPEHKASDGQSDIEILFIRCKALLFFAPKHKFFSDLIAQTGTGQRESLTVDRTKAMMWRRDGKVDHKLTVSVFSQLCNLTNTKPADLFRSSERIYRISFAGEGATDAGGPYNETLSTICDELQSQLVPLLTQTPNHRNNLGELRDSWLPDPNCSSESHLSHFKYLGKMLGVAIRTQNNLNLSFPPLFWKRVLQEQVTIGDLKGADEATFHMLEILRDPAKAGLGEEEFAEAFAGVVFAYADSSGKSQELFPGGSEKPVTIGNSREYADLVERFRLSESESIYEEIRSGISVVVPSHLLSLFSWRQLEALVCGAPDVDVDLLAKKTSYGGWNPEDIQVKWLWSALRSFTAQQRSMFLRFVWGRSRLPAQSDFRNFSLAKMGREPADNYLPVAHTCGFGLDLPTYTNEEVLKAKVLYAITQCQGIDLDGLAGGGWVDEE